MTKTTAKPYEVDEDYLKTVMAGDVSSLKQQKKESAEERENTVEPEEIETEKDISETEKTERETKDVTDSRPRKKREGKSYEVMFLGRRESVQRKQTYISLELYKKIARFLPVIGGGLTVPTYIDNILSQHLEQYKDEINELYDKKTEKPL